MASRTASSVRGRREAGFTLLEAVVALGVFAMAALALLRMNTENIRAQGALETSALARMVAENELALALADRTRSQRGVFEGEAELAGRDWVWLRTVAPTADPDIDRIQIVVRAEGSERTSAELVGFRGRR